MKSSTAAGNTIELNTGNTLPSFVSNDDKNKNKQPRSNQSSHSLGACLVDYLIDCAYFNLKQMKLWIKSVILIDQ